MEKREDIDEDLKSNINLDALVDRKVKAWWVDSHELREKIQKQILNYESIPLILSIGDQPMRRICEVLTSYGFITLESCDWHWESLPRIFFKCDDQKKLRDLAFVLESFGNNKNFNRWARIWSWNPLLVPESPLAFMLQPVSWSTQIDLPNDYDKLKEDLDIIWIDLIERMNYKDQEQE